MREGQHPTAFLAGLLALFCLGILLACEVALSRGALLGGCGIFLVFSFLAAQKSRRWTFVPVALLFFLFGALRFGVVYEVPADDISHFAGADIRVRGIVSEETAYLEDAEGHQRLRTVLEVSEVRERGEWHPVSGRMTLHAQGAEELHIGDRVEAVCCVRRPHGYQNPGQIDTVMLLRSDGITARGMVEKGSLQVEEGEGGLGRWAEEVRSYYRERMERVMPAGDAAVIFAMLFGGYGGIDPAVVTGFVTTGIVHILSVSGSHVSLLAAAVAALGLLLRLPKGATAALVLLAIGAYSLLSGFTPPVLRAGLMGGLAFMALALDRERESVYLFLLVALGLLLWNPLLLFHVSFQLSFAATAGLLLLAPPVRSFLLERGAPRLVALSIAITVGAQLMSLPILLWYFSQVSLSAILANLFVVPIIDGILLLALLAGLLAFALPFLGTLLFVTGSLLFGLVWELTKLLAMLPYSSVYPSALALPTTFLYYGLLAFLFCGEERQGWILARLRPYGRRLLLGLAAALVFFVALQLTQPREVAVHFIDVGQGDAALVVTPHGHAVMIDTGGTRENAYDIGYHVDVPYLHHYGVHHLDAIFLTHAHEDHAAGAGSILRNIETDRVFIAGEGTAAYARSMGLGDSDPLLTRFTCARAGDRFTVDGVTVETVYAPEAESAEGNEASNVYRVTYGDAGFLFTGDLITSHEEKLLKSGRDIHATVLKVGHHGSDTSSSEAFLEATRPAYAVIEVGKDNSFGHPKKSTLEKLRAVGAKIYRTDEDGAIVFHTDGKRIRVETYADP